jgi:flagellar biosynthesis component FlhA
MVSESCGCCAPHPGCAARPALLGSSLLSFITARKKREKAPQKQQTNKQTNKANKKEEKREESRRELLSACVVVVNIHTCIGFFF